MKLRRFNGSGLNRFDEFRETYTSDLKPLLTLLEDPNLTDNVSEDIEVEPRQFAARFAAGEYLHRLFGNVSVSGLDSDLGIWTWLAAYYFTSLCPRGTLPGAKYRWVPSDGYRDHHRHLLRGPYQIYRAHQDNPRRAMVLLATPVHRPGDLVEQLASRQDVVTSNAAMEAATLLYIGKGDQPKPGSGTQGAGGPRRFGIVVRQLDLTWDLSSPNMTGDKLLELLPAEFDSFKS